LIIFPYSYSCWGSTAILKSMNEGKSCGKTRQQQPMRQSSLARAAEQSPARQAEM
jgi:hypothetical protein